MLRDSEWARRIWHRATSCPPPPHRLGWAGFQLAEMLCAPIFTFRRDQLVSRFGDLVTKALFSRSLEFGSVSEPELSRIYLANPIWERPFIALDADTLLLPLPVLIVSFPFAIIEGLLGSDQQLLKAYSNARTRYLEDDVERIVRRSLPSAKVYAGVKWTDSDTKVQYEHDVVAVLGMQVLIFEAKSGKLTAGARPYGSALPRREVEIDVTEAAPSVGQPNSNGLRAPAIKLGLMSHSVLDRPNVLSHNLKVGNWPG
jgi:hypothetical protein